MTENETRKNSSIPGMLAAMDRLNASDLFVSEGRAPHARINGEIRQLKLEPTSLQDIENFLDIVLLPQSRPAFDKTGDLDVGYSLDEDRRFRLNLFRQRGSISIVARKLPSGALDLKELGLPAPVLKFADLMRGLVLITGATNSGSSTTLAALIHRINLTRRVHIVTIEDPIEYIHTDVKACIDQREVGSDTASFHTALKQVVRQNPDIILIGEIRDQGTMSVAISAATIGHLVVATMHTIDAFQTLQRILNFFPEHIRAQAAMDLSLSLKGIVSQRLIPVAGNKGRFLVAEVLTPNPSVVRLIREQRIDELPDLMKTAKDPDIITFNSYLLALFRQKKISYEMGMAYASNPEEFALSARGMATGTDTFRGHARLETDTGLDIKAMLMTAMEKNASDLHLTINRPPILRINGHLKPLPIQPLTAGDMRTLLYSILNSRQQEIYELEREIDFALSLENGQRFRVNAYFQKGKMAAALRSIPTKIPKPKDLGLPETVIDLGLKTHGLLLVVGPTGSGKTTSLACLVDQINHKRSCRIITIEDPIEYVHKGAKSTIDQREILADSMSFGRALKYILRQDPDVILVGEMRDLETISAVLTAAETGHLVLATLHTNDAIQAIDRIIDVFPPHQQGQIRSQLAATLLGIVSQRLLQKADGAGRIAAFELLVATPAIRAVIRDNKTHQALALMEASRGDGMVTMDTGLRIMIARGMITLEEAMRYARNPKALMVETRGEDNDEDF
jgi:twitching motility protein PilT